MNNDDDDRDEKMFLSEISNMMHYYGDVAKPAEESVEFMYSILREQLNVLLIKAERNIDLLETTKEREISHREILALMLRNKAKLRSLLEFLSILDVQPTLPKAPESEEDNSDDETSIDETVCEQRGKRVKMCNRFLRYILDAEELATDLLEDKSIVDPAVHRRLMQKNAATARMNQKEYLDFSRRTAKATFCPRQRKETFKEWLLNDQKTLKEITPTALSMIEFLARETIAQIIDVALYIKSKKVGETILVPYDEINDEVRTFRPAENNLQSNVFSEIRTENEQDTNISTSESNDKQADENNQINPEHEDCTMESVADDDINETSDSEQCYDIIDADDSNLDDDFIFIDDDSNSLMSEGGSASSPDESCQDSKSEAGGSQKRKLEPTAEIENAASDISSNELFSSTQESLRRYQELISLNSQSKSVSSGIDNTQDITQDSSNISSGVDNTQDITQDSSNVSSGVNNIQDIQVITQDSANVSNPEHLKSSLKESVRRFQEFLPQNTATNRITTDCERIRNHPRSGVYDDRNTIVQKKDNCAIIPKTAVTPAEIKDAYRLFQGVPQINLIIENPTRISNQIKLICLQDSTKFISVK